MTNPDNNSDIGISNERGENIAHAGDPNYLPGTSHSSNGVIKLLKMLADKDKIIRELRSNNNAKDAMIRRLYKELSGKNKINASINMDSISVDSGTSMSASPYMNGAELGRHVPNYLNSNTNQPHASRKRKANDCSDRKISTENGDDSTKILPVLTHNNSSRYVPKPDDWDERIGLLIQYKEIHGNTLITRNYKENPQLSRFVDRQRQAYHRKRDNIGESYGGTLTEQRIKQLNDIGFEWKVGSAMYDLKWGRLYNALVAFKQLENHTRVPNAENSQLHNWVQNQRQFYKNTIQNKGKASQKLSTERIAKLQLLGFEWEVAKKDTQIAWETRFCDIITFKSQHGHCRVPREYKINQKLGNWVKEQRKNHKRLQEGNGRKGLTDDRIRRLEEVGFEWRIKSKLEQGPELEIIRAEETTITNTANSRWTDGEVRTDSSGPYLLTTY